MKKYELVFNDEHEGVFRISLVKDPAIESTLLHFNAEKKEVLHFTQDEKRIVYSVAMIPNKLIFRKDVYGENAEVFYTAETIEMLQQNYFKNGYNSVTNINHQSDNVDGVYLFESWTVNDSTNDKSNALGLDAPTGSLVQGYKIDNDAVWQDVKQGKLDGLSIEARLGFKEVTDNNNYKKQSMNKKSIYKQVVDFFMASDDKKEFTSGDKKVFATELKEGEILTDENSEPLTNGEFEIEGKIYKTDDLGSISTIEEKPAEEAPAEDDKEVEAVAEDAPAEAPQEEDAEAPAEDLKAENEQLKKDLATAQEELAKLQAEKVKADEELTTMKAETAAATPIKNVPAFNDKPYAEMTNYERLQFNKNK